MAKVHFDLLIYGAGGHGMVVSELALMLGFTCIGVFDDNPPAMPLPDGVVFLGNYKTDYHPDVPLIIAIGNNEVRYMLSQSVTHPYGILVHPSAVVSPSVLLGAGTVVLAGVIIQARTCIGSHNIINAGVVIDHDVKIGSCVHVRPQAYIGSNANLSDKFTVGPCQVVERFSII